MGNTNRTYDQRAKRDAGTGGQRAQSIARPDVEEFRSLNMGFDDLEPELRDRYERIKGKSRIAWEEARMAARAAWHRVERSLPGDLDSDGR